MTILITTEESFELKDFNSPEELMNYMYMRTDRGEHMEITRNTWKNSTLQEIIWGFDLPEGKGYITSSKELAKAIRKPKFEIQFDGHYWT